MVLRARDGNFDAHGRSKWSEPCATVGDVPFDGFQHPIRGGKINSSPPRNGRIAFARVPERLADRGRDQLGERKSAPRNWRGCIQGGALYRVRDSLALGGGFESAFESLRKWNVPLKVKGKLTPACPNRHCGPWILRDCGKRAAQNVDIVHIVDRNASVPVG